MNVFEEIDAANASKSTLFNTTFGTSGNYTPEQRVIMDLQAEVSDLQMQLRIALSHIARLEAKVF